MKNPQQVKFTHLNDSGRARMVDVGLKPVTTREAVARGRIRMRPETLALIKEGRAAKGDVLAVAQVAGIMAAKKTADVIPLCHPLPLTAVDLQFEVKEEGAAADGAAANEAAVEVTATVRTDARTGVEMEALTVVSVALLTVYDMCKAVDRGMEIGPIFLVEKSGGRSGRFVRGGSQPEGERGERGDLRND